MHPYYVIRFLGGVLYLIGALIMAWNIWKTVTSEDVLETTPAPAMARPAAAAAE